MVLAVLPRNPLIRCQPCQPVQSAAVACRRASVREEIGASEVGEGTLSIRYQIIMSRIPDPCRHLPHAALDPIRRVVFCRW